jgi:predicted dehydrogenase
MINRRNFIQRTGLTMAGIGVVAAAPGQIFSDVIGANEKLTCGLIGANGMGMSDLRAFLALPDTQCIAICDVDDNVLNKRLADTEKIQGFKPQGYHDFRKLLENKDIDVVIIGTPDHWHCIPFVYAAQEGKAIYCEKPLSNSIEEINIMERAARKYKVTVQIGQWQRSDPHWLQAVQFVRSGKLGKIREVRTWSYQGWMSSVPVKPDEPVPPGVDYDFWLGPAPLKPFNPNRFHFTFRWFWDYAGGMMTDWGVHIIDYALFGMDVKGPKSVMAMGGKFAYPQDATETPDTLQAIYEFDGFTMLWDHAIGINGGYYGRTHGVGFVGNNGTLVVDRNGWEVIPEVLNNKPQMEKVDLQPASGKGLDKHMENFVDYIRGKSKILNTPVEVAANTARVCHLGNIAFKTGRRLYWDNDKSLFINDKEANAFLTPVYRKPWELPKI